MTGSRLLNREFAIFFTVSQVLVGVPVFAAGFQLNETSPSLQGSARAGAAAANNDVSALFNNPATLSTLKQNQAYLGASEILPRISMSDGRAIHIFNVPGSPPTSIETPVVGFPNQYNLSQSAFIPDAYIGWQTSDKLRAGIAFTEPYYLSTHYDIDSVFRFSSIETKLRSLNINPVLAYRLNDYWSFGAGAQAQYLSARLSHFNGSYTGIAAIDNLLAPTIPTSIKNTGWGYGYTLGALYQPNQFTRLGISYRSHIVTRLDGHGVQYTIAGDLVPAPSANFLFNSSSISASKINTPGVLTLGAAHDLYDWTLKAALQVNFWNTFRHIRFSMPHSFITSNDLSMKWNNAWFGSLGADYHFSSLFTVRGGIAYDQTPVNSFHREPRIPDSDRIWLNIGLSYIINKQLALDGAYAYQFLHDQRMHVTESGLSNRLNSPLEINRVSANYRGFANVFSLALRYSC